MSVQHSTQVPTAVNTDNLPPVAAIVAPTVDDRIYACVVLGNILEWIKTAVRDLFNVCILQPIYDLLETIQVIAVAIIHGTTTGSQAGVVPPVGMRNRGNNCWAIATMQIVMNNPSLQQRIIENPNPDLEPLRVCIRQYKDDQAHGLLFSRAIDSQGLRRCFLNDNGSGVEDINDAWTFLLEHIATPPVKYSVLEEEGISYTEGFSELLRDENTLNLIGLPDKDMLVYYDRPRRLGIPVNEAIDVFGQRYVCESFLIHTGAHFAAYVKKADGWWFCDDLIVRRAPAAEIQQQLQTSYIHYYSKVEPSVSSAA